ncbi:hypothetical protein M8C21_024589, partial [Ambrosia artemisiifolia]
TTLGCRCWSSGVSLPEVESCSCVDLFGEETEEEKKATEDHAAAAVNLTKSIEDADELSMAEYGLFGLVAGQDKLFANAILLRLVDMFMSVDKQTKLCVVKMFLSELKRRKNKSSNSKNRYCFSKYNVPNQLELLRRIKLCFNSGDEEVRAIGDRSDFGTTILISLSIIASRSTLRISRQ